MIYNEILHFLKAAIAQLLQVQGLERRDDCREALRACLVLVRSQLSLPLQTFFSFYRGKTTTHPSSAKETSEELALLTSLPVWKIS